MALRKLSSGSCICSHTSAASVPDACHEQNKDQQTSPLINHSFNTKTAGRLYSISNINSADRKRALELLVKSVFLTSPEVPIVRSPTTKANCVFCILLLNASRICTSLMLMTVFPSGKRVCRQGSADCSRCFLPEPELTGSPTYR